MSDNVTIVGEELARLRMQALLNVSQAIREVAEALKEPIQPTVHVHGDIAVHSGAGISVSGTGRVTVDGAIKSGASASIVDKDADG